MLLRLAEKAFRPGRFPFPLLHIDTGHNFPEVIAFRDARAAELGERLIVRSVEDSIAQRPRRAEDARREPQRAPVGHAARRDRGVRVRRAASAARAATRRRRAPRSACSASATRSASGTRKNQRPELWNLYNARVHKGEHVRVFPISNWTELDVWQYIERERLAVPSIYYAHTRPIVRRSGAAGAGDATHAAARRRGASSRCRCASAPSATSLHRAGRVGRGQRARDHRRDRRRDDHRARRHAPRRPDQRRVDGAAQEGGLLLMSARDSCRRARPRRAAVPDRGQRRRRQEHAHRPPAVRHQGRPGRPARRGRAHVATSAAPTLDLSLLTDGLTAEREQGITIDVAYRYFATALRKFIIADAPGHEQYTRNMVTAASTAQLAVLLVDARHGIVTQTRRHATLAHLLGIRASRRRGQQDGPRRLPRGRLRAHRRDFRAFAQRTGIDDAASASCRCPRSTATWSSSAASAWPGTPGPTLLRVLETTPVGAGTTRAAFRFPVQFVSRPAGERRPRLPRPRRSGLDRASAIASTVLPSGRTTTVSDDRNARRRARRARSCTTPSRSTLADEVDVVARRHAVSAGKRAGGVASASTRRCAGSTSARSIARRTYVLRHTTREVRARVDAPRPSVERVDAGARAGARCARHERHRPGDARARAADRRRPLRRQSRRPAASS